MSGRIWFSDFKYDDGALLVKKTGARVPVTFSIVHDVFTWFAFYFFAQSWRIWRTLTGHKRPTIAFSPDKPRPWYFIWPVMHVAGAKIISDTSQADIVFQFDDTTVTNNVIPVTKPGAIMVNFDCNDISKTLIADVFARASGYDLAVDPLHHKGPIVEKSELNAAHDGRIIMGPMKPVEGKTYQRLIDNEIEGGMVEDLRTCIVGGEPTVVFRKRRPLERRFMNENSEVILEKLNAVYSKEELDIIRRFAASIHLDWGGIDVLRDKTTGRIHIVDANKTDMGPPVALALGGKLRATRRMARGFAKAFAPRRTPHIESKENNTDLPKPMASPIPFIRDIEFEYGRVDQVSPLIRRVIADNAGPFTFIGTGVYIVGKGEVAVIDPGPMDETHFEALKKALEGETVTHVLVTHGHSDHSPLAAPLAKWAGCKTYAYGCAVPTAKGELGSEDDPNFSPDVELCDGDIISGPGWTLEAIHTPGHTATHMCFALKEENALFAGDHIMGWSTTIVAPPDGDMGDYMRSLDKVQVRNFDILWPTHGAPIKDDVPGFIDAYRAHRKGRESAIIAHLERGEISIRDMVADMYADVEKRLHPAAALSVLGHMRQLVKEGVVVSNETPCMIESSYRLVRAAAE